MPVTKEAKNNIKTECGRGQYEQC